MHEQNLSKMQNKNDKSVKTQEDISIKQSIIKAARALFKASPLILGTILLVSLITSSIPKSFYPKIFTENPILDSLIGSLLGSISVGTPLISYIIGGELLQQGVTLLAVTAFLIAWVTVGVIQLPAESFMLGKRFAIIRNASAFILAILAAIITISILKII